MAKAEEVRGDQWRHDNIGRILNNAVRRFEARVLFLMAEAGHRSTRISQISLTRNLDRTGTRITELATRSGMTKQAMGELVQQCDALGIVEVLADPADGRAKLVRFSRLGLRWLEDFRGAVDRAEREMREEIGVPEMDAVRGSLGRYGSDFDALAETDASDAPPSPGASLPSRKSA